MKRVSTLHVPTHNIIYCILVLYVFLIRLCTAQQMRKVINNCYLLMVERRHSAVISENSLNNSK